MAPEMMTVDQNPNVSHWKLESGYDDDVNATNAYPIRVFTGRQSASLVLFLGLFEKDLDYVCRSLVIDKWKIQFPLNKSFFRFSFGSI